MWSFSNPVEVICGSGSLNQLADYASGKPYVLVTCHEAVFEALADRVQDLIGRPLLILRIIAANPTFAHLDAICNQWREFRVEPELIVAVGGGSVIDTAKVLAVADGDFHRIKNHLRGVGELSSEPVPIVAIPTTAGTGSEVTCWATLWHGAEQKKFSLKHRGLYPRLAIVDPDLTTTLPEHLVISTGLDALSHALESLWNNNGNAISSLYAVEAARILVECLPRLVKKADNDDRCRVSRGALMAGLAFSNTRTALAHEISYSLTLHHGIAHGIACSFTLPVIMRSLIGQSAELDRLFSTIFHAPPEVCPTKLQQVFDRLGIATHYQDYGIGKPEWCRIVVDAFQGERGKNFIGGEKTALALQEKGRRKRRVGQLFRAIRGTVKGQRKRPGQK